MRTEPAPAAPLPRKLLSRHQEDFLKDLLLFRRASPHTVSSYKRDLSLYNEFLKSGGKREKAEQAEGLKGFFSFLAARNLSARSQARAVSALRSFFHFQRLRGRPSPPRWDLTLKTKAQAAAKLPRALKLKEFQGLIEASKAPAAARSLRNKLVLSLLYGLGMRVTELAELQVKDFHPIESLIKAKGKGRRERLLPVPQDIGQMIRLYLSEARPLIAKRGAASLICNNRGAKASRVDIWRWLREWSLKAGFGEVKNPHSFRHGFATGLLDNGADLRSIQKLLGHKSIQTTQIYTQVAVRKLKEMVEERHPLA